MVVSLKIAGAMRACFGSQNCRAARAVPAVAAKSRREAQLQIATICNLK
jgi:hypothetical protein